MSRRWIACVCGALALGGCDPLVPQRNASDAQVPAAATSDTMALLRAGSATVCAAAEVKQTVRDLILPKLASLNDMEVPLADKEAAIAGVTVKFDYARLDAFDPAVAKASCQATVSLKAQGNDVGTAEELQYVVSPSADEQGTFIVSAGVSSLRTWARGAVAGILNAEAERRLADAEQSRRLQDQADLARIVSARWLVGRWIAAGADAGNCIDGPYDEYRRTGDFAGYESSGRWSLSGVDLSVRMAEQGETQTVDTTITQAAADSFTEEGADRSFDRRRCTRAEMTPAPDVPADAAT